MKLTTGQTLWWVWSDRRSGEPCSVTVTAVGRKWATLSDTHRIDLTTLRADGRGFSSPGRCYESEAAWREDVAVAEAWRRLRSDVERWYSAPAGVTLSGIEAARAALGMPEVSTP